MNVIQAAQKVTARTRPVQPVATRPVTEALTTHAGTCPHCDRETRVGFGGLAAVVYGSCRHFRTVAQRGELVELAFEA